MRIAGTGTRDIVRSKEAMDWMINNLTETLVKGKEKLGDELSVISGMAEGFDEALAIAAIKAKVPFHAYIPGHGFASHFWGESSTTGRDRLQMFERILSEAAEVHYTVGPGESLYQFDIRGGRREHINFIRNYDMVDACDKLWVYPTRLDGKPSGGTAHAYRYAKKIGCPYHILPVFQTKSA